MIRRGVLLCLVLIAGALAAPGPAQAHKVIAAVFAAGGQIEGEIGFSNGDMAVAATVQVTDPAGRALGTTRTDAEGRFTFTPTEPVAHLFRADLGAGHVASITLPAADVARILDRAGATVPMAVPAGAPTAAAVPAAAPMAEAEAMAAILRDELRPLRQEIAALKERNGLQQILGGIGYIAGLCGLGFYLAARRRLAAG